MEFTAGFIGGALCASAGSTFFIVWLFYRWSKVLAHQKQKNRAALYVLRGRDGRKAERPDEIQRLATQS
jgi:hypothetical protein